MKSKLMNIPIEDREKFRKYIGINKEVTYSLNSKCPLCRKVVYLVKEFGNRVITCPHCDIKFETK